MKLQKKQGYRILLDVVKDYHGILASTTPIVDALGCSPRNWDIVLGELRPYALKHFYIHDQHAEGLKVIETILRIFFEGVHAPRTETQEAAADSLLLYLEKILMDGTRDLSEYAAILDTCFAGLHALNEKQFTLIVTNAHQLKKLGQLIIQKMSEGFRLEAFNALLIRFLLTSLEYWMEQEDPSAWIERLSGDARGEKELRGLKKLFSPLSHAYLKQLVSHVKDLGKMEDLALQLRELLNIPGYMQLLRFHEDIISELPKTGNTQKDLSLKMSYLLWVIRMRDISGISENLLREINRVASEMTNIQDMEEIKDTLGETIQVLKEHITRYPETSLYCIQSLGNAVYARHDSTLVEWFIQEIISVGFQHPEISGATEDWQVKSNAAHLKNIRVWLTLIEHNPQWSKSLAAALIINLRLGGVQISDTDLFQKDITKLLNCDIAPVYHVIKQMVKLFPAYFSEIGADGALREVSTEIDEVTGRSDRLVHFLRKQSHVESSARVVDFIEKIIDFWRSGDKSRLREFLPDDVWQDISSSGPLFDELSAIFHAVFSDRRLRTVQDLLRLTEEEIFGLTQQREGVSEREQRRAYLAIRFYQLLNKKYNLDPQNIFEQLQYAQSHGLPNADPLIDTLRKKNVFKSLEAILDYLQQLKEIILAPERHEPVENIFRKRHIAAGIASIYGLYHERKFDALALSLRLENLAVILLEDLIHSINLNFITRATLFKIEKYARLFFRVLQLDGISSNRLDNMLELLTVAIEVRRFSFSQYIDIFRGFSDAVQDILNTYYSGVFKNNLKKIILQTGRKNILPKYLENTDEENEFEFINKISEQFLRETVAGSFGLQQLDTFISMILKTLFEQAEGLDIENLDLLMSYDPKKALSNIHSPNKSTNDRIHLGNKGHNLMKLASLGIPVPPGFIITTEVFRCEKSIHRFRHSREHLEDGIRKQMKDLEKLAGKRFGSPKNPLLVSVRSGAAISMPGMMISFLNVGINESIINGLVKQTGRPWFAWDCYRRFLQAWGMSFGMERDDFDALINTYKTKYSVSRKIQFSPDQMKEVAFSYRNAVKEHGIEITDDPRAQIRIAIDRVFRSWFSKKAQAYREILGISDNWGTAVIVQAMVYGNLDINSGTGVLFTRNPQDNADKVTLWGDCAIGAQGEDVVLGLVKTLPISNEQKPFEDRTTEASFEERFPELYQEMLKITKDLIYREQWGAQEVEFTFEGSTTDKLYFLQTRDMAITRRESFMAFIPSKKLSRHYMSRGIGVGGSALSGIAVFDLDEIQFFREKEPSVPLILIRSDTVPDDIRHISAVDGLLTARGGSTSHAAIIANRLGKTCVVGCNNLLVWEQEKKCKISRRTIKTGDFLSIDGLNGSVYSGKHRTEEIKAEIKSDVKTFSEVL